MVFLFSWRTTSMILGLLPLAFVLALPVTEAQASQATPPATSTSATPTPMPTEELTTPEPPITGDPNACVDGRLHISDLANADLHLQEGLHRVSKRAEMWQSDAQLVELRLACPLLKTGLQWEGTFFSPSAQANFSTDTFDVEPSEEAPDEVPYLDVANISFQAVHRSLLRAGYSDDLRLAAASSVTIRRSTEQTPFGPPIAPPGVVYVHVAVEERGVIKDVWVNAEDGTIYRYDLGG
ncbi:MAG TPA: hypothetical protein VGR22_10120 [Thermomicrobiales bacterium]|nr:hypothetical protein [Thermomicrobiales bacterium]